MNVEEPRMDAQKIIEVISQQRNAAMDSVVMLAVERDALAVRVKELEAKTEAKDEPV